MVSEYSSTYDALAPRWNEWSSAVVPDLREEWTRKIEAFAIPGEAVVELGCGTGVPVGRFLASRYEYTGIDASPGMLAQARAALPRANLVHADMHTVDFAPASLGAVVAFSSISHTPRDQHSALFAKIASWIRPGGVFIGNLHSRDDPDSYEPSWLGAGPMRWSGFDGTTNVRLLTEAGFSMIESAAPDLHEPEGETICPLWFAAARI
jgi:SAM-dependent methyltransferase